MNLLTRSWSLHDEDELWIEANDADRMVVCDTPLTAKEMTERQYDEYKAIFEHIIRVHNESLLGIAEGPDFLKEGPK